MRTIKFRAWCNCYETMIYSEELIDKREFGITFYCDATNYEKMRDGKEKHILMQFTGLIDKNGKEIFEGDIIENDRYKDEVIFKDAGFRLEPLDDWLYDYVKNCEVIGNIHQNPELLKGKK